MIGDRVDPRWAGLEGSWRCAHCGTDHAGIFDLGCPAPAYWKGPSSYAQNSEVDDGADFLSEDFCVIEGAHYFIRGLLCLPLVGRDGHFAFGMWSSVSQVNFRTYVDGFDGELQAHLGTWPSFLSNQLPCYPETLGLRVYVQPQDGRRRPRLVIADEDADHPLAIDQRRGLTFDRLLAIYSMLGHPALGLDSQS